jgi:hypothetical protein
MVVMLLFVGIIFTDLGKSRRSFLLDNFQVEEFTSATMKRMEKEMKIKFVNLSWIVVSLCLFLQACSGPAATPTVSPVHPTEPQPTLTVAVATSTPTQAPTPTQTLEPTKIVHVTRPGEPAYFPSQTIVDCTIGRTYVSNLPVVIPASCDNPVLSFIERPITADSKAYLPYLDIGQVHFGGNRNWIYARIDIYEAVQPTGTGDLYYFFKLDLNFDGRNNNIVIISVKNLPLDALTWTVNGVQAWSYVEGTISTVFDQGVGADSDLIWARRSPKAIEFAFKPAIFQPADPNIPSRFAWTAWAYQGAFTPTDLALSTNASDLYQIDNTCAWGFNVSAFGLINHCIRE